MIIYHYALISWIKWLFLHRFPVLTKSPYLRIETYWTRSKIFRIFVLICFLQNKVWNYDFLLDLFQKQTAHSLLVRSKNWILSLHSPFVCRVDPHKTSLWRRFFPLELRSDGLIQEVLEVQVWRLARVYVGDSELHSLLWRVVSWILSPLRWPKKFPWFWRQP